MRRWLKLPPDLRRALAVGERGGSFLRLVVRVRINLMRCVVGMVGETSRQVSLPHLYSHISVDLHSVVSELIASCQSSRSETWSSRRSSDLFLVVPLAFASGRGEVISLEQGCWSGNGGSVVHLWLCQWEAADIGLRQHEDIPRSTCHNDMCLVACSGPVHRLAKPCWRWCFLGSSNGGGSTFLPVCILAALELDDGR
jgi:hypothetical protein